MVEFFAAYHQETPRKMVFTPYPNEIYSTFSFLGFIMCILPLPWHLKAWNGGTCLYMFWAGMGCLIFFINSIVWHGNAYNPSPIWCDICVRILIGSSIGVPASSLCINRRLYLLQLNPAGRAAITKSDKMRVLAVDLTISAGLPVLIMILQYIPQGHRFNILEDIGCLPYTYTTWVGIVVVNLPPVLIGLVSATYGIRAVIAINKRRTEFNELLSRHLNVTSSVYFRLMVLAGIESLLTVPISGFFLISNLPYIQPWISWEDTHSNFDRVDQVPALIWHNFPNARIVEFSRWIYVICAILFFSFFGFGEEAVYYYRLTFKFFLKVVGIRVGRETEIITFRAGPVPQSDPADRITFAKKKGRRPASFSTISTVSSFQESEKGGEQGSDEEKYGHDQNPDRPPTHTVPLPQNSLLATAPHEAVIEKTAQADSLPCLTSSKSTSLPPAVKQGSGRRPSVSRRTLRSFINFGHDRDRDSGSTKHASFPHPSQVDISTVEAGQPSKAKHRPSGRFSRHFRSFLNLN